MGVLGLLSSYMRTRRMRFTDRSELEAHQAKQWARHAGRTLSKSRHFRRWVGRPLAEWPTMDKALMMRHFDAMNTAGLRLDEVLAIAHASERSRDFRSRLGRYSVGLSSGTSGGRGVFVVSPQEQSRWAGVMLARLLPAGLFHKERVALLLRAGNNLYRAVRTPWVSFEFFDLFQPLQANVRALEHWQPSIIVAPAQVLRALAIAQREGRAHLKATRVVSVAEVLEPQDRVLLEQVFGRVDEVYQATEGFLACTCSHGVLHLNEEFLHVEPQWLDEERFVPLITDFTRTTQPVVRYRLDDVLVRRASGCSCGSATMALARIEGRCDDVLRLPGKNAATVDVFADVVNRALAQTLPPAVDYRLVQTDCATLALWIEDPDADVHASAQAHLSRVLAELGVDSMRLRWVRADAPSLADFMTKRRRVRRTWSNPA